VGKNFKEWLSEGESLYNSAMAEYQSLEAQIIDLEQKLTAKREEVNEIARVVNKEPIESNRRLTAEIVERGQGNSVPNNPRTIANALTGKGFGR